MDVGNMKGGVAALETEEEGGSLLGLESTVGVFAHRIARKLKERESVASREEQAAEVRNGLILEAMTTIRKALQETLRINLGERFCFELDIDDWEGWPRVQLSLIDSCTPETIEHALIVTPNDRRGEGSIQISLKSGRFLGSVQLVDRAEMQKLPLVLKKAVREYLDLIANYILNPVKAEHLLAHQSKPIDAGDPDLMAGSLKNSDVFMEEVAANDNRVATVDEVLEVPLSER
jgi:hypothetical protein